MSNINLSAGPPFPHQPGDAGGPAQRLASQAGAILATTDDVTSIHSQAQTAVAEDLAAPIATAPAPVVSNVQQVSRTSLFAAGVLQIFDGAVRSYNQTIDGLNQRWTDLAGYAPAAGDGGNDPAAGAFAARQTALRTQLQSEQRQAQAALDGSAADVAGLLRLGPDAMANPAVASAINAGLTRLPDPPMEFSFQVRILTLNAGGGKDNSWRNENGLDPGDVDQLAERILDGDVDVATLQEMFADDLDDLEDELEEQSGDEWSLTFAPASQKIHWGSGVFDRGLNEFGNVVAVRAPDDGETGATGISIVDTETEELAPANYSPLWAGSDGRSMAAVTIEAANGERLTIGTAHTDYDGVSAEEQAGQIEELRTHTEDFAADSGSDHVVLTGDLNHTIDEDTPSGETLRDFVEDGCANAGESVGPTSDYGDGKPIDFVFTGEGLGYRDVERIEGDQPEIEGQDNNMSDHDGIAVTVEVPNQ